MATTAFGDKEGRQSPTRSVRSLAYSGRGNSELAPKPDGQETSMHRLERRADAPIRRSESTIEISPSTITRLCVRAAAVLVLMSALILALRVFTGHGRLLGFGAMFDVVKESNIPTWFSSVLLLLCSLLLWIASRSEASPTARYWRALAVIFLVMSMDETAMLHERIGGALQELFGPGIFEDLGFVVPGAAIVLITAVVFLRFVLSLPAQTRRLIILAGALYGMGACGMEAVSRGWAAQHSPALPQYALLASIEEALEFSGLLVFIHALTTHLDRHAPDLRIAIRGA